MAEIARHESPKPEHVGRFAGTASPGASFTGRRPAHQKACPLCADRVRHVDYKDVARLRQHIGDHGRLESRRRFGICASHQRSLSIAVKRARYVGLVPVAGSVPRS